MVMSPKHEAFCQAIARGMSQAKASAEAGFNESRGYTLHKRPEIQARIAELSAKVEARRTHDLVMVVAPTRDWVLRELIENIHASKEAKDRASVNRGLELVGKEVGMFVQRTMALDSPLSGLPADRLLALVRLIDAASPAALTGPTSAILDAVVEPHTDDAADGHDTVTDTVW